MASHFRPKAALEVHAHGPPPGMAARPLPAIAIAIPLVLFLPCHCQPASSLSRNRIQPNLIQLKASSKTDALVIDHACIPIPASW